MVLNVIAFEVFEKSHVVGSVLVQAITLSAPSNELKVKKCPRLSITSSTNVWSQQILTHQCWKAAWMQVSEVTPSALLQSVAYQSPDATWTSPTTSGNRPLLTPDYPHLYSLTVLHEKTSLFETPTFAMQHSRSQQRLLSPGVMNPKKPGLSHPSGDRADWHTTIVIRQ